MDVSVVIPSFNRAEQLRFTLKALLGQTLSRAAFEIIVVDDGSTDETRVVVEEFQAVRRLSYIKVTNGPQGAAKARNAGIRSAESDVIVFLDADVLASPNLVESHLQFHRTFANVVVLGPVFASQVTPDSWPLQTACPEEWNFDDASSLFLRAASAQSLRDHREPVFRALERGELDLVAPWAYFWTTNVSAKKATLEAVALFDENFDGKGSEDLELGYRLHQYGCTTKMAWAAEGFHQPHSRDWTEQIRQDRSHEVYFLKKFSELGPEALAAFDCGNMNPILVELEALASANLLADYPAWDVDLSAMGLNPAYKKNLLIGAGRGQLLQTKRFQFALELNRQSIEHLERHFPYVQVHRMLGIALPFDDDTFDAVLITDLWRYLPETLTARILQESLRVGKHVFLMKTSEWKVSPVNGLADAIKVHDHPYWERSVYISRTFHDYCFRELAPATDHTLPHAGLFEVFGKHGLGQRF